MADDTRTFDITLDIAASREDVWQALTDPRELTRWFPLQARVTPGVGGSTYWSWGEAWTWIMRIDGWEPERRLLLVEEGRKGYDAEGRALPAAPGEAARLALDITLETVSGKTRLRLVHSGFGRGGAWDDEFDGISAGWTCELRNLRHYLERHRGHDRRHAWARCVTALPIDAAWAKLTGPGGFGLDTSAAEGCPYVVHAATGDRLAGTVRLNMDRREFLGTVADLDDGTFRLSAHRAAGQTGVMVWLSSYGAGLDLLPAFERRAQQLLAGLYPS